MKKTKFILSSLLMIAACSFLFAFVTSAASDSSASDMGGQSKAYAASTDSGSCGDSLIWVLDDGELTISGTGAMSNFAREGSPWYSYRESIVSVELGKGVTSVGSNAFYRCTSLKSVSIPSTVTGIGDYAFYYCSSLKSIVLPDSVTSIGDYAFCCCESMTNISLPSGVKSIGDAAFYYCGSLTAVTIPENVKSIGNYVFYYCTALKSVSVPDGVTAIGKYAFANCENMSDITIPESMKSIAKSAFYGCTSLRNVYYGGSKSKWNAITIADGNTLLTAASIHCADGEAGESLIDISACTVTLSSTSYVYDGSAKKPSVTVKYGKSTLRNGRDYSLSYSSNVNAGTAKVTVSGIGNYTGSVKKSFTIKKADQTLTAKLQSKSIGVGKTTTISASGKGTITYKSSDSKVATVSSKGKVKGAGAGTATITVKAAGNSNYSSASKKLTISVTLASGEISALSNKENGIKISWGKVTGAAGYRIYRKTSTGSYVKIATVKNASTVSYVDKKVKNKNGTSYTYKVVPYSGSTKGSFLKKTIVRLSGTSLTSVKNSASKTAKVKWEKDKKASGYQIQYSTSKKFSSGNKKIKISGANKTSSKISKLKKGKTYYVRIRTYKKVGGTCYYSAWSSSKKVKIKK